MPPCVVLGDVEHPLQAVAGRGQQGQVVREGRGADELVHEAAAPAIAELGQQPVQVDGEEAGTEAAPLAGTVLHAEHPGGGLVGLPLDPAALLGVDGQEAAHDDGRDAAVEDLGDTGARLGIENRFTPIGFLAWIGSKCISASQ